MLMCTSHFFHFLLADHIVLPFICMSFLLLSPVHLLVSCVLFSHVCDSAYNMLLVWLGPPCLCWFLPLVGFIPVSETQTPPVSPSQVFLQDECAPPLTVPPETPPQSACVSHAAAHTEENVAGLVFIFSLFYRKRILHVFRLTSPTLKS